MIYARDIDVGFIHNPKSAGTSITNWMKDNFDCIDLRKHGNHIEFFELFPTCKFVFGVVRNPWDRLVSWYRFANQGQSFQEWITNQFQPYQQAGLTFHPDFKSLSTWYRVCTPQYDWFGDNCTTILSYETLEDEFDIIRTYTGCNSDLPFDNKNATIVNYKDYYDDNLKTIIGDVFAKDIVKYNYEF